MGRSMSHGMGMPASERFPPQVHFRNGGGSQPGACFGGMLPVRRIELRLRVLSVVSPPVLPHRGHLAAGLPLKGQVLLMPLRLG